MIELTEAQAQAVAASEETPPTIVDPKTNTTYVLIRRELYEQMMDDSWTAQERDLLREESAELLDTFRVIPQVAAAIVAPQWTTR